MLFALEFAAFDAVPRCSSLRAFRTSYASSLLFVFELPQQLTTFVL